LLALEIFPLKELFLLLQKKYLSEAKKTEKDLNKFQIPCQTIKLEQGNVWEEVFQKVAEIKSSEEGENLIVNTATGDRITTCAATSAAFVNGLKAFSVMGSESMLLPIMKFSYYKILTPKKLSILEALSATDCCSSLHMLSKRLKMSLPLISYHINGNLKSEGLIDLGLVETEDQEGRVAVGLSSLGNMLIKGYIHS